MQMFINFYSTYVRRKEKKWMEARQSSCTYQGLFLYSFINLLWSKVEGNVIEKEMVIFMEIVAINYKNK